MRPVTACRIRIEIERAGVGEHVARCRRVGDETVHPHVGVAIRQIDAGRVAMAGKQATAPEIESALETAEPAAGARIGERLVAVVDLLAVEARPIAAGNARAVAAGIRPCQRVTDTLVQRAQRREAKLSRDRLHDAVRRELRSDDRPSTGRQRMAEVGPSESLAPLGLAPAPGPAQ